jgi:predicted metalloprotease with PDZ domain
MLYKIFYKEPHKRFIDIELHIDQIQQESLTLRMAAWRPGRYELQNYSRNILKINVEDISGNPVFFSKTGKESWEVTTSFLQAIVVKYTCYAYQMDAGGCWIDEEQLYLNFVYCLLYVQGRDLEPCKVALDLPLDFQIACGLKKESGMLYADDFYELADSPMIASSQLRHESFVVKNYIFHLWIKGNSDLNWEYVLTHFEKFAFEQIQTMGDFPEKDYHFLYELLPYRQHHGVEHRNSTIITLGPSEILHYEPNYLDFLSISSHELFHAWNIVKIRPSELLPYDLSKENFFRSGFIVEGITTYYGEFFLARAGVFTHDQYFSELNIQLKKHFENFGNFNLSLAESSVDLWVDGYVGGIPNRKVSVYIKGAIIALILDIEIRKATENVHSLDDVMVTLWNDFGKKKTGYTIDDFRQIVEHLTKTSFQNYFEECVFGASDLKKRLSEAFQYVGCILSVTDSRIALENMYGLKIIVTKDGRSVVEALEPGAPAEMYLSREDELVAIDGIKISSNANELTGKKQQIVVSFFRKNKLASAVLKADGKAYYQQYKIVKNSAALNHEKMNFEKWLKSSWQ